MARLTEPVARFPSDDAARPDRPAADLAGVARSGVLALMGAAASALLGVVFVLLVTHAFTKEVTGVLFACTSLFLLAYTAARLGAGTGLIYFIARLTTLGRTAEVRSVVRIAVLPLLGLSLLIAVGMFATAPQLAELVVPADPSSAVGAIRVLAFVVPVAAVSDAVLTGTRGFHRMLPLVAVEKVGRPALQVVLVLVAIGVGASTATAVSAAWAVPYVPTAVVGLVWLYLLVGRAERRDHVTAVSAPGMTLRFWRFTLPRAAQSLVQVALQRLDVVLLSAMSGPAVAAVYGATTRFLVFGQLGSQAISTAVQPKLSQLLAHQDRTSVQTVYQASTGWLVLLTWPVYLVFAAFADYVPLVFGKGYDAGTPVIIILALAMLVATGCGMVDSVLAMAGKTTWNLYNALLALVIDVVLNLILIPRYGMVGAAVAWAVAIAANNLVPLAQVRWALGLHPYSRGTVLAMTLSAACFGLLPGGFAVTGAPFWGIVGATILGSVGFVAVAWRQRDLLELDNLGQILRRRRAAR